eukprot:scaffold247911_cov27-Tisochrysis_lutea.AAC.1
MSPGPFSSLPPTPSVHTMPAYDPQLHPHHHSYQPVGRLRRGARRRGEPRRRGPSQPTTKYKVSSTRTQETLLMARTCEI